MSRLSRAVQRFFHGIAVQAGVRMAQIGDTSVAEALRPTITWGTTNPPTHSEVDGSVYILNDGTADLLWIRASSSWGKAINLSALSLASSGTVTITGAGKATFTGPANVLQGATDPDDLSDIGGIADGRFALGIMGTGVTNLVDSATLSTPQNATIPLAAGDRILFIRSGTVHYAVPLFVQAGVPTSATAQTSTASGANTAAGGTGATGSAGTHTDIQRISWPVLGLWGNDLGATKGGLVGQIPATPASETAAFAVVYDHGSTTFRSLAAAAGMGGGGVYTSNFQLFPDVPAADDAFYFGADILAAQYFFAMTGTVATYTGDSMVLEYWNGAAWSAQPTAQMYDYTDSTAGDGKRPFQRAGSVTVVPQADHAATTITSELGPQLGYWFRYRVLANNTTVIGIAADEHARVLGEAPFVPSAGGTFSAFTLYDNASTLHTANDVVGVVYDSFTGESRSFTFAQDRRVQRFSFGTPWVLTTSSRLSVYCVREDGTNEPTGVILGLEYSTVVADHTHTGPSHDHAAGAITVTNPTHTHQG